MSEWKTSELGLICEVVRGGSPRPIMDYLTDSADGVNWLKIGDVNETDKYFTHSNEKIKASGIAKTRDVKKGDLILSNSMSFGRAFITQIDGYIHDGWLRLRNDSNILDKEFLYYYLSSPIAQNQFKSVATGSVVNNLKSETVKAIKISLPPLSEQKIIADTLSALDDKIENNNKINHNLLELSNDLFNHMISTLPKNGQIGDYCSVKSGFAFKSDWWRASGVRVIKIGSIKQDNLDLNTCSYVELDKVQSARDFLVKGGDLLIAMTGATIGKFTMVPKTNDTLLVNQRVGKFFLGDEPVKKIPFIYCQLKQPEIANEIVNRGQGSAQPNISASDIMTIPCVIPQEKEINAFNEACSPLFKLIIQNQFENRNLTVLKDTLLPRLMSGEIDVSKIEDYAAKL